MHIVLISMIAGVVLLVGCQPGSEAGSPSEQHTHQPVERPHTQAPDAGASMSKVLDGEFDDWGADEWWDADGRWLWLRFAPQTRPVSSIQAAGYTTRIRLDLDFDPSTGRAMEFPRGAQAIARQPQGVDLLISLSPRNETGGIGIGTSVISYTPDGDGEEIGHAAVGFACLPTYASEEYEVRLDRLSQAGALLEAAGSVDVVIDQVDERGEVLYSQAYTARAPIRDRAKARTDATIMERPEGSVRVMSANVLFSSPLTNPEPFDRVLRATAPDVILYQEWFKTERAKVEAWIAEHGGADWTLHFPDEKAGVAIATRLPVLAKYDRVLPPSGEGRPARACAALIDTDAGELLAISVHLKCCGGAGSEEDLTRIDQARAINGFVRWVHEKHPGAMVVISGDFNLVGSRTPLDVLARDLGVGGADLQAAHTQVLGDPSVLTWVDEKSRFGPGRLDWMLIDPSRSVIEQALMLDSRVLDDASLGAMGLERLDSTASDHLPMVVDLGRRP